MRKFQKFNYIFSLSHYHICSKDERKNMAKYKIIGNMTGNSMDAIDLVLTEFDGDKMQDICTYTKPYSKRMQEKIERLRTLAFNKTRKQIESLPDFTEIHNEYITEIADCINEMCRQNHIDKTTIDAIGFHGKTLDHNPPSKARNEHTKPYTLQMGSGQMLADLTGINVVYDFRSDYILAGYDGAPLAGPHNAHIAKTEGDGFYYNGGNTANFALIQNAQTIICADAGPFNEYIDNFVRTQTNLLYDQDGQIGRKGQLDQSLLQKLFDIGRNFYETPLPKSGDPAFYHKSEIFDLIARQHLKMENTVHTFEYFAAYIATQALTLIPENIKFPSKIFLFGGGWKNPIVLQSFSNLLKGKSFILPEHNTQFEKLRRRFATTPKIVTSNFGDYMEARLLADLAYFKLQNKAWPLPEIRTDKKQIVCGIIAKPGIPSKNYDDCLSRAAKK